MGKARETAFRASSLSWATKILSTTLYSAWTSMEIMMGMDMDNSSRLTGMVPILFSAGLFWLIVQLLLSQSGGKCYHPKGPKKRRLVETSRLF